jgi:hypothetical protein
MVSALCTSLDRVLATNHSIFAPNDAGWNHQCCGSHSTFPPNHSAVPEKGRFSCRLESGEHPNYTIGHHITANDINAREYDCQKTQYSNYIFVGPYIGFIFTAHAPEYVVLGETVSYSFEPTFRIPLLIVMNI